MLCNTQRPLLGTCRHKTIRLLGHAIQSTRFRSIRPCFCVHASSSQPQSSTRNVKSKHNGSTVSWGDRISSTSSLRDLLDLVQQHSHEFSIANTCNAFCKLSRVCTRISAQQKEAVCALPFVQQLGNRIVQDRHDLQPYMAANVLYAHSTLHHGPPELVPTVAAHLQQHHALYQTKSLAHMLHATVKLREEELSQEFVITLYEALQHHPLWTLTSYGVSRTLYAMVHLQEYTPPPARLCEGLVNAARQHVVRQPSDDMDAHTIASMCWGLSKLQLYDTSVFDAAAGLVVLHIDTFNVIDVSNMMHAFARAYTHWANLAPEGLVWLERGVKTRHLKRLVTHNPTRRAAIQALAKRVSTLAPSMNARGVSTCFWCFGVLQWEDSVLFDALAKRVVNIKQHLDVQALCNIAWSCGYGRYHNRSLLLCLAEQGLMLLQRQPGLFFDAELLMLLSGYANCYITAPQPASAFILALADRVADAAPTMQPAALTIAAWSLIVCRCYHPRALASLTLAAADVLPQLQHRELYQWHQAEVAMRLEAPPQLLQATAQGGAEAFLQRLQAMGAVRAASDMQFARHQEAQEGREEGGGSVFQAQVVAALQHLGLPCHVEYGGLEGLPNIDIALVKEQVAIEVDGPAHFAFNNGHVRGGTRLRRRMQRLLGWRTLSVPYWQWHQLGADAVLHRAYLTLLLARVDVHPPSPPLLPPSMRDYVASIADAPWQPERMCPMPTMDDTIRDDTAMEGPLGTMEGPLGSRDDTMRDDIISEGPLGTTPMEGADVESRVEMAVDGVGVDGVGVDGVGAVVDEDHRGSSEKRGEKEAGEDFQAHVGTGMEVIVQQVEYERRGNVHRRDSGTSQHSSSSSTHGHTNSNTNSNNASSNNGSINNTKCVWVIMQRVDQQWALIGTFPTPSSSPGTRMFPKTLYTGGAAAASVAPPADQGPSSHAGQGPSSPTDKVDQVETQVVRHGLLEMRKGTMTGRQVLLRKGLLNVARKTRGAGVRE